MARGTAACFSLDKIRGVTVDVEAHVASVEPDDGVWLRGCVVHENVFLLDDVGGGQSLLGAYFVDRNKHGGVDGAHDIEEGAGDTLHACDAGFINFWCGCGVWGVLHLGPVRWHEPFVGRVLGAWGHGVLEAIQGFADRVGHGDVDVISGVVPFDGQATVLAARWVDGDGVIILERVDELGGVVCGKELDTKVVYIKGGGGG